MKHATKIIAIAVIAALVISLALTAMGLMTWRFFWIIAILAAVIAYYVLPEKKKDAA